MMPRDPNPRSAAASPPTGATDVEFRSYDDDAWYNVRILLPPSGHQVRLMHYNLSDAYDRVFNASDFRSLDAVRDFRSRFRLASPQLQDSECGSVTRGTLVCASHSPSDGYVCFYDAVVESVDRKEHDREDCACSFMLVWRHGPNEGKMVRKCIESICVVQSTSWIDPKVESFLEVAMKQISKITAKPSAKSGGDVPTRSCGSSGRSASCSGKKDYSDIYECAIQAYKHADHSTEENVDKFSGEDTEDIDLGGVGKWFMIFIENLEKDLQASSIEDLLQSHTSVSTRACIFPCFPMESYARGAIFVDSETSLQKLYDFFEDPDQIIVSTRGRPLMVTGKLSGYAVASFSALVPKYLRKPASRRLELRKEVKVVRLGTAEYAKAKELKEMVSHFLVKQKELYDRLEMLEENILKQPTA